MPCRFPTSKPVIRQYLTYSPRGHGIDAWVGRTGWRPYHAPNPPSHCQTEARAIEQRATRGAETSIVAEAGLGHSHTSSNSRAISETWRSSAWRSTASCAGAIAFGSRSPTSWFEVRCATGPRSCRARPAGQYGSEYRRTPENACWRGSTPRRCTAGHISSRAVSTRHSICRHANMPGSSETGFRRSVSTRAATELVPCVGRKLH